MKKYISLSLVLAVLLLTSACRKALKNEEDYFVKLSITSATVQTDGTVLVKAEIQSPGKAKGSAVQNAGFCASAHPSPQLLEHQLLATTDGSSFSAVYPANAFSDDSAYYFRAFATNDYGYSFSSNTIRLDSVIAPAVTAPCTLAMNSENIGGGHPAYTYYSINAPDSYNHFIASGSGGTVEFQFGSGLTTGIFHTTTNTSPASQQVYIIIRSGSLAGVVSTGSNVYVNKQGTNTFEIQMCTAPWSTGSATYQFSTRFVTPL